MFIDVKETLKKYFLVGMKEACGDALSLKTILNLKEILKGSWLLQMATWGRCYTFVIIFFIDDSDAELHPD